MLLAYNFHKMVSLHYEITDQNLKVIANSYIELWSFEVANLDVRGSLVLLNQSHTYIVHIGLLRTFSMLLLAGNNE